MFLSLLMCPNTDTIKKRGVQGQSKSHPGPPSPCPVVPEEPPANGTTLHGPDQHSLSLYVLLGDP